MDKPLISKTAAIKTARAAVGLPVGSQTSYQVTGPWDDSSPRGASTTIQRDSYANAMVSRRYWIASIALTLMGYDADAIAMAFSDVNICDERSAEAMVQAFIDRQAVSDDPECADEHMDIMGHA